jgi:hypothetical protein
MIKSNDQQWRLTPMLILVVDDRRTFTRLPTGAETIYARTVKEALEVLNNGPIDQLWLDHDLGENENIRSFVLQIEERAFNGEGYEIGSVVVHTSNPDGANWIMGGLRRYYPIRRVDAKWYI